MTWLEGADAPPATLESVLSLRPELLSRYRDFYRSFWDDGLVPHRILELCRLRIAAIHDCDAEWAIRDAHIKLTDAELDGLRRGIFDTFTQPEQAALDLAEKLPHQHGEVSDADVGSLETQLGAPGAVAALTAIAFFDVSSRLRLLWGVPERNAELTTPPLEDGHLP